MYMEMFGWVGFAQRVAGLPLDVAEATKPLGFNPGLYNGFLFAGLVWSLRASAPFNRQLAVFFRCCVLVAGLVGFATIAPPNYRVLIAQSLLAALALVAVWKIGIAGKRA